MNKYWERRLHTWSNSVRKRLGKPKRAYVDKNDFVVHDTIKQPRASFSAATSPRLAVVSKARGEALRAHEVMRHFTALFDAAIVIDPLSTDETSQIVAGYDGNNGCAVTLLRSEMRGHAQSDDMTEVCTALIETGMFDWIFFIDFDEFLPFEARSELHQTLVHLADNDLINFAWINCLQDDLSGKPLCDTMATISETFSEEGKVAVNARRLRGRTIRIEEGSHSVLIDEAKSSISGTRASGLFRFPVSDPASLTVKLGQGVGEDGALPEVITAPDGVTRKVRVRFAQAPGCDPVGPASEQVTTQTLGEVLHNKLNAQPVRARPAELPGVYKELAPRTFALPEDGKAERVERAILSGAQALDVVVPTSWAGHEPFLFSLMEAMRPRRYVELGSHHGHSFFTACQNYKLNGNYGEAVAIDLWEGDHQAGFYGNDVFDRFRLILDEHYKDCGRFIRSYFSEAVKAFEPGSIDLLHIDGLHTYGAVKEDFETWFPKLTENSVVLFHDTSEYQTDFGVWQFFDEVRSQATASFRFVHGHGLGVLAFGARTDNPAIELIEHIAARPALFEFHYANLGASVFTASRFKAPDQSA